MPYTPEQHETPSEVAEFHRHYSSSHVYPVYPHMDIKWGFMVLRCVRVKVFLKW
jgi:hypothetical protein